jgi:hypothetical protein
MNSKVAIVLLLAPDTLSPGSVNSLIFCFSLAAAVQLGAGGAVTFLVFVHAEFWKLPPRSRPSECF